ncbi:hypothetical protein MSIBF_A1650001 [groundwater metagenome]|uniref:Uncharacterized protein n=1 Tax=groundwater metagenome TaxID=717931 RepID=A0A098E9N4_9ZZZZ
MGKLCYPDAKKLLITADGGGSNSSEVDCGKANYKNYLMK